jgi:hypothetical protein
MRDMTYQIKMFDKTVHDLVDELIASIHESVTRLGHEDVWPLVTDAVFGNCRHMLEEHIVSSQFCGMQAECEESLTPALPQSQPLPPKVELPGSPHVHRYVLKIDLPLSQFLTLFIARVLAGMHQKVDVRGWGEKLGQEMQAGVRKVLSKYLYESDNCGATDLCRDTTLFNPFER